MYNVTGIEVITRTRTEHMSESDREKCKGFDSKFLFLFACLVCIIRTFCLDQLIKIPG